MSKTRRRSTALAFLLLTILAVLTIWNVARVRASKVQHDPPGTRERSVRLNIATQKGGGQAQPAASGSLYSSATQYPEAVQPVIEDLAAVLLRAKEQSSLQQSLVLQSQRLRNWEPQGSILDSVSPAHKMGANMRASKRVPPFTLMTPSPPPDRQFDTNPDSNLNRPDSAIAAGPTDLVTAVNFAFQVQDLNGGNVVSMGFNSFFPDDPTKSIGDPRLSYDQATGRFIMSVLGFDYPGQKGPSDTGDSWADVAVSATSDPRGAWNKLHGD